GISRNRRDYFSNVRINNGLTAGLGVGTQWNFADLAALSFELSLRHVDKASPSGKAAKIADAGILVSFYLPEGWVPLIPKEELSLEDLETPLDSAPGQVDEALQMQGEINRVLQQIEDGQTPPVTFEAGNSIMLTTSYEALDNIGAILRRHPEMKVRVYGFVEEEFVGGVVRGETLALARAEAVRTYLNQNFRLPDGTLISAGLPPLPAVLDGQEPPPPARHISFEVLP
ncbi:MAG TPA: OmpA family protein, partial [Elusimicrobiota bacterium]|nr:OmpA family protein [Elusimicrobiota bacterium]